MTVIGAGRAETTRAPDSIRRPAAPGDGIARLPLPELMARSDFVVLACSLNESTFHLIGEAELAVMQPHAFLINVARGAVVDEKALIAALRSGRIAGAGLDVFEVEPVEPDNPLLKMDEVIVAPHSLCWTDETFGNVARTAIASICDVHAGRPTFVVNPVVLKHPRVLAWLGSSRP
jgi:phosphoglycerate dehydrogenase-like enzyme